MIDSVAPPAAYYSNDHSATACPHPSRRRRPLQRQWHRQWPLCYAKSPEHCRLTSKYHFANRRPKTVTYGRKKNLGVGDGQTRGKISGFSVGFGIHNNTNLNPFATSCTSSASRAMEQPLHYPVPVRYAGGYPGTSGSGWISQILVHSY